MEKEKDASTEEEATEKTGKVQVRLFDFFLHVPL